MLIRVLLTCENLSFAALNGGAQASAKTATFIRGIGLAE